MRRGLGHGAAVGSTTEAIPYFEEGVRVDSEYAAVSVYLARAYEESNQPDLVLRTLLGVEEGAAHAYLSPYLAMSP